MRDLNSEAETEQARMENLQAYVDATCHALRSRPLTFEGARRLIYEARVQILHWFPEKGDVFDLILRPRFNRILDERIGDMVFDRDLEDSGDLRVRRV